MKKRNEKEGLASWHTGMESPGLESPGLTGMESLWHAACSLMENRKVRPPGLGPGASWASWPRLGSWPTGSWMQGKATPNVNREPIIKAFWAGSLLSCGLGSQEWKPRRPGFALGLVHRGLYCGHLERPGLDSSFWGLRGILAHSSLLGEAA